METEWTELLVNLFKYYITKQLLSIDACGIKTYQRIVIMVYLMIFIELLKIHQRTPQFELKKKIIREKYLYREEYFQYLKETACDSWRIKERTL